MNRGLQAVNLHRVANKRSGEFSGGMKRRLSVAISFMGNPAIIYLDEPSTVRARAALGIVSLKAHEHVQGDHSIVTYALACWAAC